MSKKPFFSVVICSYNGASTVGRAIESVLAQDYPQAEYEVVVVDDGSSDGTAEIIARYPVRFISMGTNQGLSAARNAALRQLRGQVFVGFDDDCIAEPNWLSELARGYLMPDASGVGGQIIMKAAKPDLVTEYMFATGCGNPPTLELNPAMSVFKRFLAYYRERLPKINVQKGQIRKVRELNGANTSFYVKQLRAVGGWDSKLSGVEDTDLCRRISAAFPNKNFYAVDSAQLQHDPGLSLYHYLRRFFRRGAVNLTYYRQNNLVPPIFPFPLLIFAMLLASILTTTPLLGLISLASPLVLYSWWPIRAVLERKPGYLPYPYIQFFEESFLLAGLLRGYLMGGTDHV